MGGNRGEGLVISGLCMSVVDPQPVAFHAYF